MKIENITVEVKNEYGNERIYPICDNAIWFASLSKQVTLSRQLCKDLKSKGVEILYKQFTFNPID